MEGFEVVLAALLVSVDDGYEDRSRAHQRVLLRLYAAERHTVLSLRRQGIISNDVMHRLERELDLGESHLEG